MLKKILVLDKAGMAPSLVKGLECRLELSVNVMNDGSLVRNYLKNNAICLAIVNPYLEYGEIIEAYVNFIKNLKEKDIPVLIFSRAGVKKLAERGAFGLDLVLNKDYQAYLRKPVELDKFIECVRGLIK
jgi:CheY-like chemotaxis protein